MFKYSWTIEKIKENLLNLELWKEKFVYWAEEKWGSIVKAPK